MPKKNKMVKNKPVFTLKHPAGFTQDVVFVVDTYSDNQNLYLGLEEADTGEPFTNITRNFGKLELYTANIKNVDENEGMVQFLLENEMGLLMGNMTENYPLFMFYPSKIQEIDPDNQYGLNKKKQI